MHTFTFISKCSKNMFFTQVGCYGVVYDCAIYNCCTNSIFLYRIVMTSMTHFLDVEPVCVVCSSNWWRAPCWLLCSTSTPTPAGPAAWASHGSSTWSVRRLLRWVVCLISLGPERKIMEFVWFSYILKMFSLLRLESFWDKILLVSRQISNHISK